MTRKTAAGDPTPAQPDSPVDQYWEFRLYVAGHTPRSIAAIANLKSLCEEYLPGRYDIEIVDLLDRPEMAGTDAVVAIPTVVRNRPEPVLHIVGDLSDTKEAVGALQLKGEAHK